MFLPYNVYDMNSDPSTYATGAFLDDTISNAGKQIHIGADFYDQCPPMFWFKLIYAISCKHILVDECHIGVDFSKE